MARTPITDTIIDCPECGADAIDTKLLWNDDRGCWACPACPTRRTDREYPPANVDHSIRY